MGQIQTSQMEMEALCAQLAPVFLEYLRAHGTAVNRIEEATSLEGITSLPARYSLGGVEKNVLAPLKLLTKDVDEKIEACSEAADKAETAADNANAAALRVETAVENATEATEEAYAATLKATTAADTADGATANAEATSDRLNTLCDNRDKVVDGYWWHYNESTKAYENTGEIAKGNVMYATFEVTDAGRLLMHTDEEYTGASFALDNNGVLTVNI